MAEPYKDPADMTDEELDAALNPPEEVEEQEEEAEVVKPEKPEAKKPEGEEEQEESEEGEENEEGEESEEEEKPAPISRRKQLRMQQLYEKLSGSGDPVVPTPAPKNQEQLDYEQELESDPETVKRLNEDRQRAADEAYQRGIEQSNYIKFDTRLEIDSAKVADEYPQFNPKNEDKFNPVLYKTVVDMYLTNVGYKPGDPSKGIADRVANADIRWKDFVDGLFELADEIGIDKVEVSRTNITKQASKTGLRPDGSAPRKTLNLNKAPSAMSDEELDAAIALSIPPK